MGRRNDKNEHIERGWCLTLLHEFRCMQERVPQLRRMRPPNLLISKDLRTTLGHWDATRRTITIAERLILGGRLRDILAVFHHEVAHQVVSEAFAIDNPVAHGEAFARACRLLGIPARATIDLETAIDTGDEGRRSPGRGVLARIRKLLALGMSPNVHEAERALMKAHELALRHNLEIAAGDVDATDPPESPYDVRLVTPVFKRVPGYIWPLMTILSDFYFTQYICRGTTDVTGTRYQVLELYGTPDNLDLAEYVYEFLLHQGEIAWSEYKKGEGRHRRRHKVSFVSGIYEGFRETLEGRTEYLSKSKDLVWLGDPRLDAFYRERNPYIRTSSARSTVEMSAHAAGVREGKKLRLRPGVSSSGPDGGKPRMLEG